jgi:uncharacterized repeat protein (TIGR03803 family)
VLHAFEDGGGDPSGPVFRGTIAEGRGGAMLTTSTNQLTDHVGKAFRIWPDATLQVRHEFDGGGEPDSGLVLAVDGQFYGTTATGGALKLGTVFKMDEDGNVTTLHEFQGGSEGKFPVAAPIQSVEGDFYGDTVGSYFRGGELNYGSVYRITKYGDFTLLHSFNGSDGAYPQGPLLQGTDFYFYGTTAKGGTHDLGTVFRVSSTGDFKVLVNFDLTNGQLPSAELIQATDGNFYGVTSGGGSANAGVIFRMTTDGALTVLYNFTGGKDGGAPVGLIQASDGNLYGTSLSGGNHFEGGTLFRAKLIGPSLTVSPLHVFESKTGSFAYGALLQHTNGIIYGDTFSGGGFGKGVFYSLDADLPPFVTYLPTYGRAGALVQILGQGFTSDSQVSFNGTPATFTLVYSTYIRATVPDGATTGPITVTTSDGTLTSNKVFVVHE